MRGSISQLQNAGSGFILGEDGFEVYFDPTGTGSVQLATLSVGQWVEYDVQSGPDRLRATNLRVLSLCSHRRRSLIESALL